VKRVEAILFDVNHTLVGIEDELRTQDYAVTVMYSELKKIDPHLQSYDVFRRAYDEAWQSGKRASFDTYREVRYEDIVATALESIGIRLPLGELESLLQLYMEPLYSAAYLIPGIAELLAELRQRVKLGAITNYKYANGMTGILRRVSLDALLSVVAISSAVGWKKPDARIYEKALAELGVAPTECVLVGNELEKDLWQGKKLGMTTVWFTPNEHELHDAEFAQVLRERMADDVMGCDYTAQSVANLRSTLLSLTR